MFQINPSFFPPVRIHSSPSPLLFWKKHEYCHQTYTKNDFLALLHACFFFFLTYWNSTCYWLLRGRIGEWFQNIWNTLVAYRMDGILRIFQTINPLVLNWHPLFFQNWFKGHWDTLPEPPFIGRSKQWFSSKFDFNQTIEFSWSSFLVMITNPISAGTKLENVDRQGEMMWNSRFCW